MLTLNAILKELKNVPVDRLEDLYSIIHSLNTRAKKSATSRAKILSFAGAFGDMTRKEYNDFIKEVKHTRADLFDRNFDV